MYIWLVVCDVVIRRCSSPFLLSYPSNDSYAQHGQDLIHRLVMENCLSHFNGVSWSRAIFKKPTAAEIARGHVTAVNILNPNQTGFFDINMIDISSMTLGSFQPGQGNNFSG